MSDIMKICMCLKAWVLHTLPIMKTKVWVFMKVHWAIFSGLASFLINKLNSENRAAVTSIVANDSKGQVPPTKIKPVTMASMTLFIISQTKRHQVDLYHQPDTH